MGRPLGWGGLRTMALGQMTDWAANITWSQRIDRVDVDDVLDVFGRFDVSDGANDQPIEWLGLLSLQDCMEAVVAAQS